MRLLCSLVLGRQCRRSAEYPVVLSNRTTARTVRRTQLLTQNLHPRQPTPRIVSYSTTRSIGGTQIPIARDEPPRLPSRGFLPWRFSDAGRPCARHRPSAAGIRKPSQEQKFTSRPCILTVATKLFGIGR